MRKYCVKLVLLKLLEFSVYFPVNYSRQHYCQEVHCLYRLMDILIVRKIVGCCRIRGHHYCNCMCNRYIQLARREQTLITQ